MAARKNTDFGAFVRETLGELSLRQARNRTGVDIDTIGRMKNDEVPRVDKVIDFARGFGKDVNEALQLAGYPPVESAADVLLDGWWEIRQEFPEQEIPFPEPHGGVRGLTMDAAKSILAIIRKRAQEGRYPPRQREE